MKSTTEVVRFLKKHLDGVRVTQDPLVKERVQVEFERDGVRVGCRVLLRLPMEVEDAEEAVRAIEKKARPLRGGVG